MELFGYRARAHCGRLRSILHYCGKMTSFATFSSKTLRNLSLTVQMMSFRSFLFPQTNHSIHNGNHNLMNTVRAIGFGRLTKRYTNTCQHYTHFLNITPKRTLKTSSFLNDSKKATANTPEVTSIPGDQEVILIGEKGASLKIIQMVEAEKFAQKKNLNLVYVNDQTQSHPVFKLMTGKELHELSQQARSSKKTTGKSLMLRSSISEHDLEIKMKKIVEWVKKGERVNLTINKMKQDRDQNTKDILKKIKEKTKEEADVKQVVDNEKGVQFLIVPKEKEN